MLLNCLPRFNSNVTGSCDNRKNLNTRNIKKKRTMEILIGEKIGD